MSAGFPVIMADPAWQFVTRSSKGKGRSPEQHYDCMTLDEIKALPVASIAADDAVLLLWAIDPLLEEAFKVGRAWGFTPKTVGFYWTKTGRGHRQHVGMGYWTRANPEQCLLMTRGKPKRVNADVQRWISAPRGKHSEKPHGIYSRVERLVAGPYVELFARYARPGWSQWGNQVGKLGGTPSLVDLPGYPARAAAPVNAPLFEAA
ncbi:hypothetical protein PMNALOAF_2709 [Methylobacterium adhaesivum]|uniref:MT-A70 family methyltransferase n=1 Tax=Methylobacterium adhaesivum TaxID=333297 RepID=A0ABT8BJR9_9HYPH|nr:MT-A70 family methyltransferase [Methylobacterium adhaesivum]MDN3592063.1 MT-A70 family methyltransferase [Methylobacterium adhaesivum]GJD31450.1 hypothetical protein PMNALOAF_2709 [Methylobacterium adhaesivum]